MSVIPPYSFELFPPRTPAGWEKLPGLIKSLSTAKPEFFSVTYGAGGSDQEGTYDTLMKVVDECGIEAAPHLTCVGSSRQKIGELLDRYKSAGVRRIVALRGDLPATAQSNEAPGDFHYANELVEFIRERHGNHFQIEVAAYPETHPQANSVDTDFEAFVRKAQAGADSAITQYFFNADAYFDFAERCAKAGLKLPIIPGIMPITNHAQLTRFSAACSAEIPRWIRLRLELLKDDKDAIVDFGTDVIARLCENLIAGGAPGLHIYTLNQADPTLAILGRLRPT